MDIVPLAAIISFLALDTTAAFQMLISSPLFTGPLLGYLLGDPMLGFEMGFLFQLLWLGKIPVGATFVPEGNVASMIGTTIVLLNRQLGLPHTVLTLAFIEGVLISYLGALVTVFYRKINGRMLQLAISQIQKRHFRWVIFVEVLSMVLYGVMFFAFTLSVLYLNARFLPSLIRLIGGLFEHQLIVAKPAILGIGIAFVLPLLKEAWAVVRKGWR